MFRKKEILSFLGQYNSFLDQFNKEFKRFRTYSENGDFEKVENSKKALQQINSIIIKLQKRLDTVPHLSGYNRNEGYNCTTIVDRIDILSKSFYEYAQETKKDNGENKYDNNGLSDTRIVPVNDAKKAAKVWGEGYKPLTDFLETCISNEIQTLGCCSGHYDGDKSYVLFNSNDSRVIELANYLSENKLISTIGIYGNEETKQVLLGIYLSMEDREKTYELANNYIKERKKNENIENDSVTQKIVNLINSEHYEAWATYSIKDNQYEIDLGNGVAIYSAKQLEDKLKDDTNGTILTRRKTIIETIKDRCANTKLGLQDIMPINLLLIRERSKNNIINENDKVL